MSNEQAGPGVDAERARELGGAPLNTDPGFGHRAPDAPVEPEPQAKDTKKESDTSKTKEK